MCLNNKTVHILKKQTRGYVFDWPPCSRPTAAIVSYRADLYVFSLRWSISNVQTGITKGYGEHDPTTFQQPEGNLEAFACEHNNSLALITLRAGCTGVPLRHPRRPWAVTANNTRATRTEVELRINNVLIVNVLLLTNESIENYATPRSPLSSLCRYAEWVWTKSCNCTS